MSNLPEGWVETTLAAVTRHRSGNSKLIKGRLYPNAAVDRFPGFSASGQDVWLDTFENEGEAIIVSAVGARCGKAFLAHDRWSAIANTHVVWPADGALNPRFLWYRLNDERFWLRSGSAQPFVLVNDSLARPSHLPPRREQDRIVLAIEQHLSDIDAGVAALERVRANLKRYRASVLKAACEGRLVPTEAELARKEKRKYEPADVLLARILRERRARWEADQVAKMKAKGQVARDGWKRRYEEPKGPETSGLAELPAGWVCAAIDQLASLVTKGSSPNWQGFEYCENGIMFVRSQNVGWGVLDLVDVARLPAAFNEKERKSVLRERDVLLNIVGASIGRAAVATAAIAGGNVNQAVAVVRPVPSGAASEFIVHWLLSASAQRIIHANKVDVARANLSLEEVATLPMPLPPLAEQHRIVAEVERLLSMADEVDHTIRAQLARAARLRQAVLKRAFEGKLVPQDPNDEPASVMLERVRDGASKTPGPKARRTPAPTKSAKRAP